MGRNEKTSERASVTLSVTCESHGHSQFASRLETSYLFGVPLHGFLGKRETVRGRIEEKTFHNGGSSPAVSNIALEREENERKEKKEVFATQGIIPSRKPAKLSLALLN